MQRSSSGRSACYVVFGTTLAPHRTISLLVDDRLTERGIEYVFNCIVLTRTMQRTLWFNYWIQHNSIERWTGDWHWLGGNPIKQSIRNQTVRQQSPCLIGSSRYNSERVIQSNCSIYRPIKIAAEKAAKQDCDMWYVFFDFRLLLSLLWLFKDAFHC